MHIATPSHGADTLPVLQPCEVTRIQAYLFPEILAK